MTQSLTQPVQPSPWAKPPPGHGLLPPDFGDGRQDIEDILAGAYAAVMANSADNFKLWTQFRRALVPIIQQRYRAAGLSASPLNWDSLWARVDLPCPSANGVEHTRLVSALLTDYGPRLFEHIAYRLTHEANVHIALKGWTGGAKSSCGLTIMDWIRPLQPGTVVQHLSTHLQELPGILSRLPDGDTAQQDEVLATAGEGSRSVQMILENLEDTMRKSKRNLIVISPRSQEKGTMQVELEVIAWNPEAKWSLFLAWVDGVPMGVVAIPWCREWVYREYEPWKDRNVANSLAGEYHDKAQLPKLAERLFADPNFVQYMMVGSNKPTSKTFRRGVSYFFGGMLPKSQSDKLGDLMNDMCYEFERLEPFFKPWFGISANDGMRLVAAKCYAE
jgi:hypothetical protein